MLYLAILTVSLVEHDEEQTKDGKEKLHAIVYDILSSSTVHDILSATEIRYTFYNAECIC